MTDQDHWVGDIGHVALADAALGALLIDVLRLVAEAGYPESPAAVDTGLTTKQAAREVQQWVHCESSLFPEDFSQWLTGVVDARETRNRILHAVTVNRCATCGSADTFVHPRSGGIVDRKEPPSAP